MIQVKRSAAILIFLSIVLGNAFSGNDSTQPNVLLIMLDDLNDYTGFLGGHPQVTTPNMDALAAEGIVFTNAHTNAPICAPSRASMLTGIYPHVSRNYWFSKWYDNPVLKNCKSLARFMGDNGYLTYGTGKLMHDKQLADWTEYGFKDYFGPYPFNGKDRVGHPSVPEPYSDIGYNDGTYASLADVPSIPASVDVPGYTGWYDNRTGTRFRYVNDEDRDLVPDEVNANWIIEKLQQLDDNTNNTKPFFLAVGFVRPHTPLVAPQKYFDMYPIDSLELPVIQENDIDDCHYRSTFNEKYPPWSKHYYDLQNSYDSIEVGLREYLQAYLACVTFADEQVGKVMDALRNSRFNDNTIVILASDHGYGHGEKEWLYKNALWEESTRIPMIIRTPGMVMTAGKSVNHPVSLIDVYPTIADLCNISADNRLNESGASLSGFSMKAFLDNPDKGKWDGPDVALTNVRSRNGDDDPSAQNYSVRSKDYRYILYDNGKEELYYHRFDEFEWENLADNPKHALTKAELKSQLKSLVREGAYYLSSSGGDDDNFGTINSPWKTLSKISTVELVPGDTIYFRKGDRFDGHFVVNGSGDEDNPIVISSYGTGAEPVITGEVGAVGGGDYQEAILVENNDNMVFDGLEVHNERIVTRAGVDSVDAYGLFVLNSGTKVMRNFIFRNMKFQNVYAVKPMLDPADFNGLEVAGLRISSNWNGTAGQEKNIRDVLVENCYFADIQRFGIHVKHGGAKDGVGNDTINRNMNIVCRNNEFHYLGGTSILPQRTYNCLIENNLFNHPGASTDPRMPGRGSSVWTWRCQNTVIQYNQCISARGYFDSHGIHIDHENLNTFIQYNYMEDCEGGFVEILGGNVNAVYRFNVSVNDGWRKHPTWKNSNHTIWINNKAAGDQVIFCDHSYIYNNTVYMDSNFTTAIEVNAKNTFIYNNIFNSTNGGTIGGQNVKIESNGTPLFLSNNLLEGAIASEFANMNATKKTGDPKFIGEGEGQYRFQLDSTSPAINNGVAKPGPVIPGAGTGIFKDISAYPAVDIFGNPVDLLSGTLNIGACNIKYDTIATNLFSRKKFDVNTCLIYPNPAGSAINFLLHPGIDSQINVTLSDLKGRVVQIEKNLSQEPTNQYILNLNSEIPNGIYLVNVDNGSRSYSHRIILVR